MKPRHLAPACGPLGIVLLSACAIAGWFAPKLFFEGYLTAFVFWVEIALGCLALLLLQNLTGGFWGIAISRLLEAGMMTLPLCALFFVPVILGLPYLFSWIHPSLPEIAQLVHNKRAYLNVPFYLLRTGIYFAATSVLAYWLRGLAFRKEAGDRGAAGTLARISGPALIVFVLLMNFASTDWVMCLQPQWYSSMLVVEFISEQTVVVMAVMILMLRFTGCLDSLAAPLQEKAVHDCGKLLLAFTCFWTYVTFSEFLITWTGNRPHEAAWFSDRSSGGWRLWALLLVLTHFLVPLFSLILTSTTKNLRRLSWVAGLLVLAHFIQVVWWIEPAFGTRFHVSWIAMVLTIALGLIWMSDYLRKLVSVPLLPRALRFPGDAQEVVG